MASKVYRDYCLWVNRNPVEVADYESMFKWGSLLLAGRSDSAVVPEILYAISNLITLHNDVVLLKKCDMLKNGSKIKVALSVLEYCEVFIEMSVSRFGLVKKWTVISIIQLIKCIARIHLLRSYNESLIGSPPLTPIERFTFRENYLQKTRKPKYGASNDSADLLQAIREIPKRRRFNKTDIEMTDQKYYAEVIFAIKPITHLAAKFYFGKLNWKPFMLSFVMDSLSLILHMKESKEHVLSVQEEAVVSQRYFRLLLYLFRSPFYDKYFKSLMLSVFDRIFKILPFTQFFLKPLLLYLIKIQHIYFYIWSS